MSKIADQKQPKADVPEPEHVKLKKFRVSRQVRASKKFPNGERRIMITYARSAEEAAALGREVLASELSLKVIVKELD